MGEDTPNGRVVTPYLADDGHQSLVSDHGGFIFSYQFNQDSNTWERVYQRLLAMDQ